MPACLTKRSDKNRRRIPERGLSGKHRPVGRSDKTKQFIGPIDSNVSDIRSQRL